MTKTPLASPRFPIEAVERNARDWHTLAAYAVEQNVEAGIASEDPDSEASALWRTLEQTIEIAERYKAALEEIERRSNGDMGRIARRALGMRTTT